MKSLFSQSFPFIFTWNRLGGRPIFVWPMDERLIQYVWKFQLFYAHELITTCGKQLTVLKAGIHNQSQGPDFLDARLRLDDRLWAGHVEVHVKASDWWRHRHSGDPNYANVILHVVWEDDGDAPLPFPTLVLGSRVPALLLVQYERMMQEGTAIPCSNQFIVPDPIHWEKMRERLLIERLEEKANSVRQQISKGVDWEEIGWQRVAATFGGSVNGDSFQQLAELWPIRKIRKNQFSVHELESLFMGKSGLVNGSETDHYAKACWQTYCAIVQNPNDPSIRMYFLRMRPSGFPTIRLAQLAAWVHGQQNLQRLFVFEQDWKQLRGAFHISLDPYWMTRYRFDVPSIRLNKPIGGALMNSVFINVVALIRYAYGLVVGQEQFQESAIQLLEQLPAEKNRLVTAFENLGLPIRTAADSQALLQLHKHYCVSKKCLECGIGKSIFKQSGVHPARSSPRIPDIGNQVGV